MAAKESPYDMAKVVERKSGEYAVYACMSSVNFGVRILETLYEAPVLSYVVLSLIGRYFADHVPE